MTAYVKPGDRVIFAYPEDGGISDRAYENSRRTRENCEKLLRAAGLEIVGSVGIIGMTTGLEILVVISGEQRATD